MEALDPASERDVGPQPLHDPVPRRLGGVAPQVLSGHQQPIVREASDVDDREDTEAVLDIALISIIHHFIAKYP